MPKPVSTDIAASFTKTFIPELNPENKKALRRFQRFVKENSADMAVVFLLLDHQMKGYSFAKTLVLSLDAFDAEIKPLRNRIAQIAA